MAKFLAFRKGDALFPDSVESSVEMAKVPFGKVLSVEVKAPRNPGRHRLFFALCHRIAAAIDVNPEALREHLTVECGHYYELKTPKGIRRYPKSIAWSKLDETEFRDLFDRAVRIIYTDWGIAREDIFASVADLLEPPSAAHAKDR